MLSHCFQQISTDDRFIYGHIFYNMNFSERKRQVKGWKAALYDLKSIALRGRNLCFLKQKPMVSVY
ncbi:hypothetical protein EVA_04004 [gut metagenome]|uniref:Uncharacterized protein n=1 Tax=gut metagenome TaxID=749906 RepID=J9GJL0_9ZZZZ